MCVVSNMGSDYQRTFPDRWPNVYPYVAPQPYNPVLPTLHPLVTQDQLEALRKEVQQLREDLVAAKAQDVADGNPDCEMDEKVAFLKKVAEFVGVDLDAVFGS